MVADAVKPETDWIVDPRGLRRRRESGVAWLCLDRPVQGNRVDAGLAQAITDACAEISLDDDVVAVALIGSGECFCLGEEGREPRSDWVASVASLGPPVVAAVHGDAVAEGVELLLACDLRIAASSVHLALPQLRQGGLPHRGATQRLPRLIGRTRALDLLLTGRIVPAVEAEQLGLVTRCCPPEELSIALEGCLQRLRGMGPVALRYAKEAVLKGEDMTFAQGVGLEQDLYVLLQTTRDREEGVRSFLEHRTPRFEGS